MDLNGQSSLIVAREACSKTVWISPILIDKLCTKVTIDRAFVLSKDQLPGNTAKSRKKEKITHNSTKSLAQGYHELKARTRRGHGDICITRTQSSAK